MSSVTDLLAWLRAQFESDTARLMGSVRAADLDTPAGKLVVRLAMDQVSDIESQRRVIAIAEEALAAGVEVERFGQVVKWLAFALQSRVGYLETWVPDGVDLVGLLDDDAHEDDDELLDP